MHLAPAVGPAAVRALALAPPAYPPRAATSLAHLDLLRCAGCVAVVVLHISLALVHYRALAPADLTLCLAINSATWWAVPVFVMISGALLLDPGRPVSAQEFFRRRLGRIGWPLVFWCVFYLVWPLVFPKAAANRFPDLAETRGWRGVWLGAPYYHLHFLFLIAGLYLFTPALNACLARWGRRFLWPAVIGGFCLASAATWWMALADWRPNLVTRFVPFVPYFLAGSAMRDWVLSRRGLTMVVAGLVAFLVLEYHWLNWARERWTWIAQEKAVANYLSPPVIGMALAIFVLMRTLWHARDGCGVPGRPSSRSRSGLSHWATATFGIYLVHPLVLDVLARMTRDGAKVPMGKPLELVVATMVTLILSYGLVRILQSLPWARRVV